MVSGLSKAVNDSVKALGQIGAAIGRAIWSGLVQTLNPIRNLIPSGSILDRALKGEKFKAQGFHGFVSGATPIIAGERGIEHVDITPMSDMINRKDKSGSGDSGGWQPIIINLDGQKIAEVTARRISVNQAVYR